MTRRTCTRGRFLGFAPIPQFVRDRIFFRGRGGGRPIPGDELRGLPPDVLSQIADGAARNARELERKNIGDLCVDTDALSIEEVARLVRATTGVWPALD